MLKYQTSKKSIEQSLVQSIKDLQYGHKAIRENELSPFADPDSRVINAHQRKIIIEYRKLSERYRQCLQDYANFNEYIPSAYQPNENKNGIYVPPTPASLFFKIFLFFCLLAIISVLLSAFCTNEQIKEIFLSFPIAMAIPISGSFSLWIMRHI